MWVNYLKVEHVSNGSNEAIRAQAGKHQDPIDVRSLDLTESLTMS
jgi:hypothetical protein